jgi:hypothetical protein
MGNATSSKQNGDLKKLHRSLIDVNKALNERLNTTTKVDDAKRIVTEMREVVHRIDLVQSLLFSKAANEITAAVAPINAANASLVQSIAKIRRIIDIVKTVTQFLTLVDDAIDLAKTLGVA